MKISSGIIRRAIYTIKVTRLLIASIYGCDSAFVYARVIFDRCGGA